MQHNSLVKSLVLTGVCAAAAWTTAVAAAPCPPVLCIDACEPPLPPPGSCSAPPAGALQGFGAVTTGGAGGEICTVTTLADSGTGSLRQCAVSRTAQSGGFVPRTVRFNVAGTIRLLTDLRIDTPFMTIDGSSAPSPGITIRKASPEDGEVRINTSATSAGHDLIITHLRFDGEWDGSQNTSNTSSTINLDGEDNPGGVYRIVLDHLTLVNASDSSPDMWGEVNDVTISWSLIYDSFHPMTISHSGGTMARHRISLHHNVFARNHERNPQIRGNVRDLDYVNNIVYDWTTFAGSGYGIRVRDVAGVFPTDMNFVNNFFLSNDRPEWALVYGDAPGDGNYPGGIYAAGNVFPASISTTGLSTRTTPVPIPSAAAVTTSTAAELTDSVIDGVGMQYRDATESALLQQLKSAMQQRLGQ